MAASSAVSRNGACTNIWDVIAWEAALDDYFAEHNEIRLDGDARSAAYLPGGRRGHLQELPRGLRGGFGGIG